jgi:hypothetical protein
MSEVGLWGVGWMGCTRHNSVKRQQTCKVQNTVRTSAADGKKLCALC